MSEHIRQRLDTSLRGEKAQRLADDLQTLVIGQPAAIEAISSFFEKDLAGIRNRTRPLANFLFLGPTGTGKTRTVEAVASSLLGSAAAVIKIDCAEFQHSHEIAKLIGSPPGYLGHRETHPLLSQEVINQHHTDTVKLSFILFDEIEKASDALWNLLLGILDKATLTTGDNRRVDFSRCMIFMTSNLGSAAMSKLISKQLGFSQPSKPSECGKKLDSVAIAAAKRKFTPEFMNRIDSTVVFQPLSAASLAAILNLELSTTYQTIIEAYRGAFVYTLTDRAKAHLLEVGTHPVYGARSLKRVIEQWVVQPLAGLINSHQISPGDWIEIDLARPDDAAFTFDLAAIDQTIAEMATIGRQQFALAA